MTELNASKVLILTGREVENIIIPRTNIYLCTDEGYWAFHANDDEREFKDVEIEVRNVLSEVFNVNIDSLYFDTYSNAFIIICK